MNNVKMTLPLWPFVLVDAFFLALAAILLRFGHHPLSWQEACLVVLCGALGAASFLAPFLRRDASAHILSQAALLAEATARIQNLDQISAQISAATAQWTDLHTHTTQAADNARQVAERIAAEAQAFNQFMQKTSEAERHHLRVEVEKLRRAEGERLHVLIHILDHVFALFKAAQQSGQPALLNQITQFQNACRDAARRIGLTQTGAQPGDAFDAKVHQLPENAAATDHAVIAETLAAGYTYQGQTLRRPMVSLKITESE